MKVITLHKWISPSLGNQTIRIVRIDKDRSTSFDIQRLHCSELGDKGWLSFGILLGDAVVAVMDFLSEYKDLKAKAEQVDSLNRSVQYYRSEVREMERQIDAIRDIL